jgi:methylmalonyl-CoA/ethylmalonyl-CoA epimerase
MGEHRITAVDHVGIAVPDLDAAIAWYADTLGLVATHEEVNEEQGVREAMLSAPGGTGGAAVQLLAPLRPDSRSGASSTAAARASSRWPTGWRTSTRRAPCCARRACGCSTTSPKRGTAGSRINFVHPKDAGGVLVELVEPAAGH